jgi:putative hydrolase of the HAD superfamily
VCSSDLPSFFPSPLLALRYQRFRKEVRKQDQAKTVPENAEGFRLRQAAWVSGTERAEGNEALVDRMYHRIERQFYASWRRSFARLKPFPGVRLALEELRRKGVLLAALSDFPIERKLEALGVDDLIDFSACTEDSGYLKPHAAPFLLVCRELEVLPSQVLYVGDSCRKDMVGAARVRMKTCLIAPKARRRRQRDRLEKACPEADIICADYAGFIRQIDDLLN